MSLNSHISNHCGRALAGCRAGRVPEGGEGVAGAWQDADGSEASAFFSFLWSAPALARRSPREGCWGPLKG
jgi:hypothetical protein